MALNHHFRTDLALEAANTADGRLPEGVFCRENTVGPIKKTTVIIKTAAAAKRLMRPAGIYHTLECDLSFYNELCCEVSSLLTPMLPEGDILVVGLGNRAMTPDALGPLAADRIMATAHLSGSGAAKELCQLLRPVCVTAMGTAGQTGLDAAEVVSSLVKNRRFGAVIAVDALAAREPSRLGRTVQLSDSGIAPGSGASNSRRELSQKTLGIPVISIGIPTVIEASSLAGDTDADAAAGCGGMLVSPKDIDRIITNGADIISMAINRSLQPALSEDELRCLMR